MTKVLLVDDYKAIHESLGMLLEKEYNHKIISAYDGKEGLERLVENPEIIVLDYKMPIKNGWEFYQELKNNPEYEKYRNIPIISIGDFSEEQKKAFDYPTKKPIRASELDKIIKKYSK